MSATVVETAGLYARDAWGMVIGLDLALPAGTVGALIGTPVDGTSAFAATLAGCTCPSGGRVTVAGKAPYESPQTRAKIGAMLADAELPDVGTVRELLAVGRALRGERPERAELLDALGCAPLLGQRVAGLDRRHARIVGLSLALLHPAPSLLVLFEPLAWASHADAPWLRGQLRKRADEGACVLVLASSTADACALADDVATLQRGRVGRAIGAPEADELAPGSMLEVRVWTNRPKQVAALLATEASVHGVWLSPQPGAAVVLQTQDAAKCAQAVARVVDAAGATLVGLQTVLPGGQQLHEATLRMVARAGGGR